MATNHHEELIDEASSEDKAQKPRSTRAVITRMWSVIPNEHWRFIAAVCCVLCSTIAQLAAPAYSAHLIDTLWAHMQVAFSKGEFFTVTLDTGGRDILMFLGIWTVAWLFYTLQTFTMASFAERLNLQLRAQIAHKLNRLPLRFFDNHQTGDIMSRVTNDLDKVSEVLQRGVVTIITSISISIGSLIMMSRYNLLLTSIFCAFIAIAMIFTQLVAGRTHNIAQRQQREIGELSGQIEEAYSGRLVITSFNRQQVSAQRIHRTSQTLANSMRTTDLITNAVGPFVRFVVRLSQVVMAYLGVRFLMQGMLTIGMLQAFFQYVNTASEPLTQFSLTINQLQSALASVERIFDILDEPEIVPNPATPASLPRPIKGRVRFEHVRFGYDAAYPLMKDVSFTAEPGQKIAIVGATGAGKTTLINLLMRFYEIDGGRITLDGVDTKSMTREDLRRSFGMVLQDTWLREGTIAQNIAYGKPDASLQEIVKATTTAQVDHFVRTLPQGYDTTIENDSEHISQGQRQLLTIARVLLANPSILILDEATSNVDTRTEVAIMQAMEHLMMGRTSFVIAHRLSTIVDADLILVMEHGNIIEQGSHAQLLALGGSYSQLYQSQFAS